jgi:hypothetical protein
MIHFALPALKMHFESGNWHSTGTHLALKSGTQTALQISASNLGTQIRHQTGIKSGASPGVSNPALHLHFKFTPTGTQIRRFKFGTQTR